MTETYLYNDFADIYARNAKTIYIACHSYMKSVHDAEDAVHDVFIKLITLNKTFENDEHEKAWLIRTAINVCKDMLKHRRRKVLNLDDYESVEYRNKEAEIGNVYDAICNLPEKFRTIILLYYIDGYSSKEIAKMLRKPQSTVTNYMSRARKMLRKTLGGDIDELT